MKLTSVEFFGLDYTASASVTSTGVTSVFDLTDAEGNQIAPDNSIRQIEFNDGEGDYIDGFRVTYQYNNPKTGKPEAPQQVVHGSFTDDEVHHKTLTLREGEYICAARVLYVGKDTDEEYIGRITLWANRPGSTHAYQAGDYGETPPGGGEPFEWHWEKKDGQLYSFGTRENNTEETRGLKTLAFGELRGTYAMAQSALYPAYDASTQDLDKDFNDLKKYGAAINHEHPIRSIEVWSDKIVEGIRVTYNLHNGKPLPVMHGSRPNVLAPTRIELDEYESIVEIIGIHGEACPDTTLGDRINLLEFKIYNAKAGMFRTSGTCGKIQTNFVQKTRKDICVRGPLVGLAGRADNKARRAGLFNLKCFTRVPPWKAARGKLVSGPGAKAASAKGTGVKCSVPSSPTKAADKTAPITLPNFNPGAAGKGSATPNVPAALSPNVSAGPAPNVVAPAPNVPADPAPNVPVASSPNVSAASGPNVPADPVPNVPADPTPNVPETSSPNVPAVISPNVPADPTPNVPAVPIPAPEALSVPAPDVFAIPAPEALRAPTTGV